METWNEHLRLVADRAAALRSAGDTIRCYALLDMRAYPDLSVELWEDVDTPSWRLWQGTDLESHQDLGPVLVEIDIDEHRTRESTGASDPSSETTLARCLARMDESATGRYAITYILSPANGAILENHYRHYCEYSLAEGQGYYLHFYDARILARLRTVWDADQSAAFMRHARELHYCQRNGLQTMWVGDDSEHPIPQALSASAPITSQQHHQLLALDYPDKVTLKLRRICSGLLANIPHDVLCDRVGAQISRARKHGLEGERDLFDYVACALTTSVRFDEHPRVAACLRNMQSSRFSLVDALSAIPDDIWDDIARPG